MCHTVADALSFCHNVLFWLSSVLAVCDVVSLPLVSLTFPFALSLRLFLRRERI